MRLSTRIAAGAVVCGLLLAGCSPEKTGTASPAPSASSSGTASANPDVPKVPSPLDPSKYLSQPCSVVPSSALSSLRFIEEGKAQQQDDGLGAAGPGCAWKISGEGMNLVVVIGTGNRDRGLGGLAGLYTAHDDGQLPFLEPAGNVEGYPAIYIDKRDRRPIGNCSLDVGIADDLAIAVHAGGYEGQQDSCAAAQQVAASIISTLKGA